MHLNRTIHNHRVGANETDTEVINMRKSALLLALVAASASADYSGFRIGGGTSQGFGLDNAQNDITANKVEIGYDVNRIFSVNLGYHHIKGESMHDLGGYHRLGMKRIDTELEAGYAFPIGNWSIKPYTGIGFTDIDARIDYSFNDEGIPQSSDTVKRSSTSVFSGIRLNTPFGVYIDGRYGNGRVINGLTDTHYTATIGIKF